MPADLTPAEVAAALKLCEAATEGPWQHWPDDDYSSPYRDSAYLVWGSKGPGFGCVAYTSPHGTPAYKQDADQKTNDASFIAAARTLLPRALKDWVALREGNERLRATLKPVIAEAKERADYMHDSWNPDAHVELTLTIAELRAIRAALENR